MNACLECGAPLRNLPDLPMYRTLPVQCADCAGSRCTPWLEPMGALQRFQPVEEELPAGDWRRDLYARAIQELREAKHAHIVAQSSALRRQSGSFAPQEAITDDPR